MIERILGAVILVALFVGINGWFLTMGSIKELLLAYGITGLIVGGVIVGMKLLLGE